MTFAEAHRKYKSLRSKGEDQSDSFRREHFFEDSIAHVCKYCHHEPHCKVCEDYDGYIPNCKFYEEH